MRTSRAYHLGIASIACCQRSLVNVSGDHVTYAANIMDGVAEDFGFAGELGHVAEW